MQGRAARCNAARPRTQRMPGSWKKLRAAFRLLQRRWILIGGPDLRAHSLLALSELIKNSALKTARDTVQAVRLLCQCATQSDAHFLKVHFPAIGKNRNHCELKRLI